MMTIDTSMMGIPHSWKAHQVVVVATASEEPVIIRVGHAMRRRRRAASVVVAAAAACSAAGLPGGTFLESQGLSAPVDGGDEVHSRWIIGPAHSASAVRRPTGLE